jgi:hypothetical protein
VCADAGEVAAPHQDRDHHQAATAILDTPQPGLPGLPRQQFRGISQTKPLNGQTPPAAG